MPSRWRRSASTSTSGDRAASRRRVERDPRGQERAGGAEEHHAGVHALARDRAGHHAQIAYWNGSSARRAGLLGLGANARGASRRAARGSRAYAARRSAARVAPEPVVGHERPRRRRASRGPGGGARRLVGLGDRARRRAAARGRRSTGKGGRACARAASRVVPVERGAVVDQPQRARARPAGWGCAGCGRRWSAARRARRRGRQLGGSSAGPAAGSKASEPGRKSRPRLRPALARSRSWISGSGSARRERGVERRRARSRAPAARARGRARRRRARRPAPSAPARRRGTSGRRARRRRPRRAPGSEPPSRSGRDVARGADRSQHGPQASCVGGADPGSPGP